MSLPWLKDDYKRPGSTHSSSRSRSRSGSRGRRAKLVRKSKSRSRSSSRSSGRERSRRAGFREREGFKQGGVRGRNPDRGSRRKRRRSDSSSSDSHTSNSRSPTRLVASDRPKYVNARVFVASILSKEVTKEQLSNHFEKYGNVVDVLIHAKNYAFIQYLKEDHAKLAVEGENGSVFNGMRINVKMANENRKGGGGASNRGGRGGGAAGGGPDRDRLPPNNQGGDPYGRGPDPYMHDPARMPFPPPIPGEFGRDPFYPDPYRRPYPPDPWMDDPYRRDPYADPYRDPYAPRSPPPPMECVVFFVNRQLQSYAESIERRIKDQSIIATSAIIPEGRTAPQMIDDLSARGGLFAIFINAQNDTHRSLTLNILHGTPQEHRNMPLDDAITLIGRSFEKYVEELRAKANATASKTETPAAPAPVAASGASGNFMSPSSEIKYLLNLLADNQALTVSELDTVIQYLKYRRDKLVGTEKGGPPAMQDSPGPSRRPVDDRGYPDRRSPEMKREAGYGKVSPSRNMDRGGYPDREERGPPEGGYNDRRSYDRDRPPAAAGNRYEKERTPDNSKPIHEELTKKILSIFQGGNPDVLSQLSSAPAVSAPQAPKPAPAPAPPPPPSSAASSANLINFDNPNVQKALDNLIQSGPNLLKTIAPKLSSAQTSLATSSGGSGSAAVPGKLDGDSNGYGQQPPAPSKGQQHQQQHHQQHQQQGQQMMDAHTAQEMYMEEMQAHMAASMGMAGHGGPQGPMHPMVMAGQMQQHMAPHFMMQGMGMGMPGQADGYGPMPGYQGASGPPLPRGAPPPPPPPHQQY